MNIEIDEVDTVNDDTENSSANEPIDGDNNDNASNDDSDNSGDNNPFKSNTEDRGKP